MNKIKINMWVNLISLLVFIPVAVSGVVLFWIIPKGNSRIDDIFLGLSRHTWTNLHNYFGLIFLALILIHIILHIYWFKCVPKLMK